MITRCQNTQSIHSLLQTELSSSRLASVPLMTCVQCRSRLQWAPICGPIWWIMSSLILWGVCVHHLPGEENFLQVLAFMWMLLDHLPDMLQNKYTPSCTWYSLMDPFSMILCSYQCQIIQEWVEEHDKRLKKKEEKKKCWLDLISRCQSDKQASPIQTSTAHL